MVYSSPGKPATTPRFFGPKNDRVVIVAGSEIAVKGFPTLIY